MRPAEILTPMVNRRPAFRATALLAGGAFALHELSYALDPATEAAGADHGYLAIAGLAGRAPPVASV